MNLGALLSAIVCVLSPNEMIMSAYNPTKKNVWSSLGLGLEVAAKLEQSMARPGMSRK